MTNQPPDDENFADIPLADAIDAGILMHREVHFGGSFEEMREYYEKEGKGISPDFDLDRINLLEELEKRLKRNLAEVLLSGPDAERIGQAKDAYKKLRNVYESKTNPGSRNIARLIADLILSEDEFPEKEIAAIAEEKSAAVPALIDLLRSEDYYDPLFPGYGLAPGLAVKCLGLIGDKRAIIALFEAIGDSDFFNEDVALTALHAIGAPAKEFLLRVLHGRPLNFDNERAAIALSQFREDPEVAEACLKMLKEIDIKQNPLLAEYLVLACEGLTSPALRKDFIKFADNPSIPKQLQQDIKTISSEW